MHFVFGRVVDLHRPERSWSNMEGQEGVGKGGNQVWSKVQSGGRGCHRALLSGINGLVALVI